MKIENIQTFNWESAIRGMRNPMKSWDKSDSVLSEFLVGEKDKELCMKLIKAGAEHSKFMRQIFISFDATFADYFWKEYSTYKVGTTENSSSTMHILMKRDLTIEDFEYNMDRVLEKRFFFFDIIEEINKCRKYYTEEIDEKEKYRYWRYIIQILPMSFLYTRTCTINYAILQNMYHQRKNHKLKEWQFFLDELLKVIPYPEFITGENK